jgi:hypothetical protein
MGCGLRGSITTGRRAFDPCGSPALGAMACGLRGLMTTGALRLQEGVDANNIGSDQPDPMR